MGKGFYISKPVAVFCVAAGIGATIVIIALSVMYAQEKSKNAETPTPSTNIPISTTPSTPEDPWQQYRLPNTVVPVSYNVTMWPRLEPNADHQYIFTGNSTVVIRCTRETDLILIHSHSLNLTMFDGFHAQLRGVAGASAPTLKKTWLEAPTEYLVVQLNSPLQAGGMYELFTEFAGELYNDMEGFYRSEYMEDGVKMYDAVL